MNGFEIAALWRYPVKSMQGEPIDGSDVDERGLQGDRQWAVVDLTTGLSLTARRQPELLFASASLVDGAGAEAVRITLPDGTVADHDDALSSWLGKPVRLVRAAPELAGRYEIAVDAEAEDTAEWISWEGPQGTFHDSGKTQVSVLSSGSMGLWDWRRFRANVVVDGSGEADLVGRTVRFGTVEARVVKPISRCVMITRPQPGGLPRDLDVLRSVNATRGGELGVSLVVTVPGRVEVGDRLEPSD